MTDTRQREYLRTAVLKRLEPLDALDANIFLAVNHLPHMRLLNTFFFRLPLAFQAVTVWYIEMGLAALQHRSNARNILREIALPLLITSTLVEFVIKPYFKRRHPFITIIQAIVIGKKPGSWSFPSGHAAGAFAGHGCLTTNIQNLACCVTSLPASYDFHESLWETITLGT